MAYFGGFPYGFPRWGYNPYLTLPILQNNNKLGGLFNEYNELNDVAARNNFIYSQNMAENSRCCKYYRETPIQPPISISVQNSIYPSPYYPTYYPTYYSYPFFNY
jgi:hypothetical protein